MNSPTDNSSLISLFAIGDVYFDRTETSNPYGDMHPLMQTADIRFCNLEAPIVADLTADPARPYPLCTPPENLELVAAGNFDVMAIAHNHLLDFGRAGLQQTLDGLDAHAQTYTGAGASLHAAMRPVIIENQGLSFGFIAMACAFPPESAATESTPGIAGLRIETEYQRIPAMADEHPGFPPRIRTRPKPEDLSRLIEAITQLGEQVDHVIVSFHWGVPGQSNVLEYQRTIGHAVVDAGAALVLGHHAHVLQGVERYAQGLIFYGLSHVIFDMPGIVSGLGFDQETAAAEINFSHQGIEAAWLHPLMMPEGASARTPSSEETSLITAQLRTLSQALDTSLNWDAKHDALGIEL